MLPYSVVPTARLIGTQVPERFAGTVHSIHEHAINIRPTNEETAPIQAELPPLVSLIDRVTDLTAASILCSRLPEAVGVGVTVRLSDGALSASACGALVNLTPRVDGERFNGEIRTVAAAVTAAAWEQTASAFEQALRTHGVAGGFLSLASANLPDTPFSRKAREILTRPLPEAALPDLVGLGPGFTPSGDDFICGALAAFQLLSRRAETGSISARIGATTRGGAILLWLAIRGSFPKYLCDFAQVIRGAIEEIGGGGSTPSGAGGVASPGTMARNEGAASAVADAVVAAVSHGETSGTDALSGFWYALRDRS